MKIGGTEEWTRGESGLSKKGLKSQHLCKKFHQFH